MDPSSKDDECFGPYQVGSEFSFQLVEVIEYNTFV